MQMKKICSQSFVAAVTMALALGLTACGTAKEAHEESTAETTVEAARGAYQPGTYDATVKGHNGDLTVQVVVSQDTIDSVTVTEHIETAGIADVPIERIPKAIVDGQTLAVDTITGATVTSTAILAAAEQALTTAGADIEGLKTANVTSAGEKELTVMNADVVIIGGGGAGMSAAVSAAREGATVIVIEKTAMLGGNTVLAGGGYNAVWPALQAEQKITEAQLNTIEQLLAVESKNELHQQLKDTLQEDFDAYKKSGSDILFDSVELHTLQTWDAGDYVGNLELIYTMCRESPVTMQELEDMGLIWKDYVLTYVGALWPRSREARDYKSGIGFIETYTNEITSKKYPVEIIFEVEGKEILMDGNKATGVKAVGTDGAPYEFTANKGVILATGGFGANVEMRQKYNTQWSTLDASIKTSNSPAITGDGILMAEKAGANLIDMELIQLLPTCDPVSGAASGYVGQATAMMINKEGVRYVNELERRDVLVKAALEQTDSMFYLITNETNTYLDEKGVNKFGQPLSELLESGKVIKGETVAELAEKLEMDAEVLQSAIDKFNEASTTLHDAEFGRNAFAENILLTDGGPYYATPRQPAVHHTMGGVQIDKETHILKADGSVIQGLYAAGEVTGGIHGANRVGANAVPDALSYGRIAGVNAANEK